MSVTLGLISIIIFLLCCLRAAVEDNLVLQQIIKGKNGHIEFLLNRPAPGFHELPLHVSNDNADKRVVH